MSLIMGIIQRLHDRLHQQMEADVTWLSLDEAQSYSSGEPE